MRTIWDDFICRHGDRLFHMNLYQILEAFYFFAEGQASEAERLIKKFTEETEETE